MTRFIRITPSLFSTKKALSPVITLICELIRKLKKSMTRNPTQAAGSVGSSTGKSRIATIIPGIISIRKRNRPSPNPCIILTST
ncbi:hypothetical protein D3C80_1781100 [compost metagenome]